MANFFAQLIVIISFVILQIQTKKCGSNFSKSLRYIGGDALNDKPDCIGFDGTPYPKDEIDRLLKNMDLHQRKYLTRQGRTLFSEDKDYDALKTRSSLLKTYQNVNQISSIGDAFQRYKREAKDDDKEAIIDATDDSVQCKSSKTPSRLCKSSFNTTAPMYGVSLTSGKPVTIIQRFPDLLQQVIYETCDKSECDLVHGECVQTYIPHLFLVIPLGPVTLTGQDYILVESGCTCRPKYADQNEPDPLSVLPNF